jgi:predicted dehydrogenase
MTTVRWGILGTGWIANAFATALKDTPGAVLAGVASRSIDSAAAFASEFGAARAYGSYQELADADDIDLVYIGTPHPMHVENALMLLEAGKGVLCEKPFTLNRKEAEKVVALARERDLFLMEAMWTRFLPALIEVRRVIASGEIGKVSHLSADFGFLAKVGPEHRLLNATLGGGALLDIGIYPLSIATDLLGPVASVTSQSTLGPTGVDVQTGFIIKHAGGGMSMCSCSLLAATPVELTVSGELGQIRINSMFFKGESISITVNGVMRTVPTPFLGNGYAHEAIEAQRCFLAGLKESPRMTHADTVTQMGVLDTIREQIGLRYPGD